MTLAVDTPAPAAPFWTVFQRKDRAIVGPVADLLLIYGSPLWAIVIVGLFHYLPGRQTELRFDETSTALAFLAAALTYAHLLPVFVRSHMNPTIFASHRWKLTIVPPLLFLALATSKWAFIVAGVVGSFWDVYHTAQQNFGLARIYEAKAGGKPDAGRLLDRIMCHAMYLGPIMAGASFIPTISSVKALDQLGIKLLTALPQDAEGAAGTIRAAAIAAMVLISAIYVVGQWRLHRAGHGVSPHKVALMTSTAAANIFAWGFCPPAIAYMAINVYHAVQYFGIVWRQEGGKVPGYLRITRADFARPATLAVVLVIPILFGFAAVVFHQHWDVLAAMFLSVSLLHFWMDGFIWSVRKKTV